MTAPIEHVVAIVGGGFSGTATAINLLRRPGTGHLRVLLVERGREFGRGLAYARSDYPYLLNVPASRMSATAGDPGEFLRFASTRVPLASGEDFLPRSLYGDYLQYILQEAVRRAPRGTSLERLHAEVVDVSDSGTGAVAELATGRRLYADAVVLAPGLPLSRLPESIHCTLRAPLLRADPWSAAESRARRGPLLIIGTGLSMVDVACAALGRDPGLQIDAISRHGLVPPCQTQFRPDALGDDGGFLAQAAGSTRGLLAVVRQLAQAAEAGGGDWREVITLVRQQAPALWGGLAPAERGRFLRHVRAYWDVHRHRVPTGVHARIEALRAGGQLRVHAGRVTALEANGDGLRARWIERGTGRHRTLDAGEVVNCTGSDYDPRRSREALWQGMLSRGLAVPDPLGLGVRTGRGGALVARDGSLSSRLFYVGPMLRADHWEATAVGELRVHAQRLADNLVARLAGQ